MRQRPPLRAGVLGESNVDELDLDCNLASEISYNLNSTSASSFFSSDSLSSSSSSPSQFVSSLYNRQSSIGTSLGMGSILQQSASRGLSASTGPLSSRGFGSTTPTSSAFSHSSLSSNVLGQPQPQQPSPSRGLLTLGNRGNLLNARSSGSSTSELGRSLNLGSSSLSSLAHFGLSPLHRNPSSHNAISGLQSSFSGAGDNGTTPPTLDLSEFPSLSNRGHGDSASMQPNPMAGRAPYVGMVKQPNSEPTEFTMSNEDFPALPGAQEQDALGQTNSESTGKAMGASESVGGSVSSDSNLASHQRAPGAEKSSSVTSKRGIQSTPEGRVTNIPNGMLVDQFGMVGLLSVIRTTETDPNLVSLSLGSDLTTLGLNLNSPEPIYPAFGGPWADAPCRPQDLECSVPQEYLTNSHIRTGLAQIKLNRYGEDLLFYIFYMYVGDYLQLAAAHELYTREWRYHKEERVWITRAPGMVPVEKTSTYERGMYYFFDYQSWRKVPKEFILDYDKLEDKPQYPPAGISHNTGSIP
ncbi:unnamed protein product [Darwinula stevensoni]|uniref:NOT2/NOT3/NOT5 C-terminal domain-containing protein n=1 Tax=Darwinula stevensoni TaxID=69355 RepID=A0A7R8X4J0_9CRUS|nr:unnamed protein product [Darwinula stevensoni]CAG0883600.1 unnamed protein product [Darwinula stevensoni]